MLLAALPLACGDDAATDAAAGGPPTGTGGWGASAGGSGGVSIEECGLPSSPSWQSDLDPYVDVPPTGPYGTHQVTVAAATNWVTDRRTRVLESMAAVEKYEDGCSAGSWTG